MFLLKHGSSVLDMRYRDFLASQKLSKSSKVWKENP